jgi:hypothetical protein
MERQYLKLMDMIAAIVGRNEFKESAVKLVSEPSTDRPDRVERLSDKLSLFRRHGVSNPFRE